MDYSKLQAKLDALSSNTAKTTTSESNKLKFSPKEGKYVIRILPNLHPNFPFGKDARPFLPLGFYYDFGSTWLAPAQFDEPDAIAEFRSTIVDQANAAKREGNKDKSDELWKSSNVFKFKDRICVPVLVKTYTDPSGKTADGFEKEGVKWWWFSPKTYRDILAICDDPDYGDIFDLKEGRDITITYTPKEKTANGFAETDILAKPKQTPATTDRDVLEAIKNMPDIIALQVKPTYEETKAGLEKYLNGLKPAESTKAERDKEFLDDLNKPVVDKKSPADVDAEFEALLNRKDG